MKNYSTILLDKLLLHLPCMVYWRDRAGRYLGCNKRFALTLGLPIQDIIGKTDAQLPWRTTDSYHLDQQVIQNNTVLETLEKFTIDQKTWSIQVTRIPLVNQERLFGVLCIGVDMTDFIRLKQQTEIANHLKRAFIQDMEHDLRTPLSGISGVTTILLSQETDPEKQDYLTDIHNSAEELLTYSDRIIELSKLEKTHLPLKDKYFNLRAIMQSVYAIEKPAAVEKNLQFTLDYDDNLPETFRGDDERIKRIFINVVGNAIKFTQQGEVVLSAKCLLKDNEQRRVIVALSVKDTGIGIPLDKQEWIYEKFAKVTLSNQQYGRGYGLGLSLVKQWITDLNGEISVISEVDKGTEFLIHLPLRLPFLADSDLSNESENGSEAEESYS